MGKLTSEKIYDGRDLENIFFRPMLTGQDAISLGIKVMYNMPVPTTLTFWKRAGDILQKYATGWNGGDPAKRESKTINLNKVKSEIGYSAEDYFNSVYELLTNDPKVNLDNLSGSELETAETALFKEAIAESIRATMWLGDTTRTGAFNTFNGFIKKIVTDSGVGDDEIKKLADHNIGATNGAKSLFHTLWAQAPQVLKQFKAQGNLALFVTGDIYAQYEDELNTPVLESAQAALINGRPALKYNGIDVIDIGIDSYLPQFTDLPQSFAILTDRRNLALAVNTNDFPGMDVRMWYNPDEMQNRQRAIFMAGCEYLLPELIVWAKTTNTAGLRSMLQPVEITTATSVEVPSIAKTYYRTVNISDGSDWTVTGNDDWFDVVKENNRVKLVISENASGEDRASEYVISAEGVETIVIIKQMKE